MKTIILSRGKVALVDDSDFEWLNQWKWSAARRPEKNTVRWYAVRREHGRVVSMHRVILGIIDPKVQVDHECGDGLDNQRTNLRLATPAQNARNRRKTIGTSRYKGVCWDRSRNKWYASVKFGPHPTHLGRFDSEVDAARAYNEAAQKHFGEFACLNAL